ncbi:MAG: hypothetical protein BWY04_01035 [candidate division CPR1 bacterium ADurb.Bin160]|uniref:Uncharacterized protein n=1 Tax=candidate division CPR1 bacterium ADurb.Bin160 TaxID=1852826 RepID=A0A1V5ZLQ9_9BACT|nr:MAG: hypothetical protein BWY04_01035 [candidate division CPR1 bacterium ADurb.Bin160]
MIIKKDFSLLKGIPNFLNASEIAVQTFEVENGNSTLISILKVYQKRVSNHFSSEKIYSVISNPKEKNLFRVLNVGRYPLPVTYNKPTDSIIINLISIGSDDISRIDPKNLYSAVVSGYCLRSFMKYNLNIKKDYAPPIINFLLSLYVKLFGKQYGLLGIFSKELLKLKFLISCYVLMSFFGFPNNKETHRLAMGLSEYNFHEEIKNEELARINFLDIKDFINSLNSFSVMPGINEYIFSMKIINFFGMNFIPAIEDISRFFSYMAASSISGNTIAPSFIMKYNTGEYNKLLDISKFAFKK